MSEDEEDGSSKKPVSKRREKKLSRLTVAELKQLVPRPEVVEWFDVSASDPGFWSILNRTGTQYLFLLIGARRGIIFRAREASRNHHTYFLVSDPYPYSPRAIPSIAILVLTTALFPQLILRIQGLQLSAKRSKRRKRLKH